MAAMKAKQPTPESVEIYITAGALGIHAGVYSHKRCWAAHPNDKATAAFRAAVKFWFGKGTNAAWLYKNLQRVTVRQNTENTWKAALGPPEQLEIRKVARESAGAFRTRAAAGARAANRRVRK